MKIFFLFLLLFILLLTGSSSAAARRLVFVPFDDPTLKCADGSPAGIYVEEEQDDSSSTETTPAADEKKQIIVFTGGSVCTSSSDCQAAYESEPFKFSSQQLPLSLVGDTILSTNPAENPDLSTYTRTLVPYCTQDFLLGNGMMTSIDSNFSYNGANLMDATLEAWQQRMPKQQDDNNNDTLDDVVLDSVVVVGISAGAIAVMNYMEQIRQTVTTRRLVHLWDAPGVLSDKPYRTKNFTNFVTTRVDLERFPLCDPNHIYSQLYSSTTSLPACCLSIYCMMRHDPALTVLYQQEQSSQEENTTTTTQDLLILDSAYDLVEMVIGTSLEGDDVDNRQLLSTNSRTNYHEMAGHLEQGGFRKARALETAALAKLAVAQSSSTTTAAIQQPHVRWLYSSCLTHTFLVPARELLFLSCLYGDYTGEAAVAVCSDDGVAMEYQLDSSKVFLRVWKTTQSWRQAEFEQRTLRQIIGSFVRMEEDDDDDEEFTMLDQFAQDVMDVRFDCHGPNCLPLTEPDSEVPSCQAFIELRTNFHAVGLRQQLIWAIMAVPLLSFLVVRGMVFRDLVRKYNEASAITTTMGTSNEERRVRLSAGKVTEAREGDVKTCLPLRGVTVTSRDSKRTCLVDNVDVTLHFGSLTALAGRSGAGKSTLLRAISQLDLGFDVTMKEGQESLSKLEKSYLRQGDNLAWDNTRPCDLLLMNGAIYGAKKQITYELYRLLEKLFHRGKDTSFNPFLHTRIGDLSGGQRRLVSIASTLLLESKVLLLDEPLSGLDSASSMELLQSLRIIAEVKGVAILMVIHQPSPEVMRMFDQLVVMNAGKLTFQGPPETDGVLPGSGGMDVVSRQVQKSLDQSDNVLNKKKALFHSPQSFYDHHKLRKSSKNTTMEADASRIILEEEVNSVDIEIPSSLLANSPSETGAHRLAEKDTATSNGLSKEPEQTRPAIDTDTEDAQAVDGRENEKATSGAPSQHGSNETPENLTWQDEFASARQQSFFLMQRLQIEHGWEAMDVLIVIGAYSSLALLLLLEPVHATRVVLMTMSMVCIPQIIFANKAVRYGRSWLEHRLELDDRLIRIVPFFFATQGFALAMPTVGIIIGTFPVYLILGWELRTYFVQCMFTGVSFAVVMQWGRVAAVWFRGQPDSTVQVMTLVILAGFAFSSVPIASWKLDLYVRWIMNLSVSFWAISGSVMTLFDPDSVYNNSEACSDALSCVVSDGRFIVHVLGFAQHTTQHISLLVLSCMLLVLIIVENLLLVYRRR